MALDETKRVGMAHQIGGAVGCIRNEILFARRELIDSDVEHEVALRLERIEKDLDRILEVRYALNFND